MHIKKLNHCCMLIETGTSNKRIKIMTDPGIFSLEQHDKVAHVDIVLITHEHADHFHIESLKALLQRAPDAAVIANSSVGDILAKEGIKHHVMKDGDALDLKGVHLEG
ncbi:MAG TPA: MBL fold metallo-hydrolase, partial [Candidatus Paceibacterota bacterium]